jgi:FdhD protein
VSAGTTYHPAQPIRWRGSPSVFNREVASEVPVAIAYNGTTHAVMMATPADLEAFGIGFALTEGLVSQLSEIERVEIFHHDNGIEVRLWLGQDRAELLGKRRRHMAGPTGCGLCGIESLEAATRALPRNDEALSIDAAMVGNALDALAQAQLLNARTHSVHAAGCWCPVRGLIAICEDVGRHNALDKLIGTLAEKGPMGQGCMLVLTSRVSLEMVQKAAIAGFPVLIAVSAPTTAALSAANASGMTVIGIARQDGFEIFTHPDRVNMP